LLCWRGKNSIIWNMYSQSAAFSIHSIVWNIWKIKQLECMWYDAALLFLSIETPTRLASEVHTSRQSLSVRRVQAARLTQRLWCEKIFQ
jgi:hypothetical protein